MPATETIKKYPKSTVSTIVAVLLGVQEIAGGGLISGAYKTIEGLTQIEGIVVEQRAQTEKLGDIKTSIATLTESESNTAESLADLNQYVRSDILAIQERIDRHVDDHG